jgi:hypothetical protein
LAASALIGARVELDGSMSEALCFRRVATGDHGVSELTSGEWHRRIGDSKTPALRALREIPTGRHDEPRPDDEPPSLRTSTGLKNRSSPAQGPQWGISGRRRDRSKRYTRLSRRMRAHTRVTADRPWAPRYRGPGISDSSTATHHTLDRPFSFHRRPFLWLASRLQLFSYECGVKYVASRNPTTGELIMLSSLPGGEAPRLAVLQSGALTVDASVRSRRNSLIRAWIVAKSSAARGRVMFPAHRPLLCAWLVLAGVHCTIGELPHERHSLNVQFR